MSAAWRLLVSGKKNFRKAANTKQTTEDGKNANAPHDDCTLGNDIATIKSHVHDDKLPSAIAAGRGELSNNS